MTLVLRGLTIPAFALRVRSRAQKGDWLVLAVSAPDVRTVATAVAREISTLGGAAPAEIRELTDALTFENALRNLGPHRIVIVSGLDAFSAENWAHLDLLRSRLSRNGPTVLIMSDVSVERMADAAPNLASWIGGSMWTGNLQGETLSQPERDARLIELRAWAKMNDADVVRLAKERRLPEDPEFVEWLVLLGRPELVERT